MARGARFLGVYHGLLSRIKIRTDCSVAVFLFDCCAPSVLSGLLLTNDSPFREPAFTLLALRWVALQLSFSAGALRVSIMSVHHFTRCEAFFPEEVELMGDVFEDILGSLHLPNRDDAVARLVASRIIELAKSGERDPERMRSEALARLGTGVVPATAMS
jgi:hypothetical protein